MWLFTIPHKLLDTLNRENKFNLFSAYQQLKPGQVSQKMLTISTHTGLYNLLKLQFVVYNAAEILQR